MTHKDMSKIAIKSRDFAVKVSNFPRFVYDIFQESINHLAVAFLEIAVWRGKSFELPCTSVHRIQLATRGQTSTRYNLPGLQVSFSKYDRDQPR